MKSERFDIPHHISREEVIQFIRTIEPELVDSENFNQRSFYLDDTIKIGVEVIIGNINRDPKHNSLTIRTFGVQTQLDSDLVQPLFENIRKHITDYLFRSAI